MPTYKDMDSCLPAMRRKMAQSKDHIMKLGIQMAINLITALPSIEVQEGVLCKQCYWYNADKKRCTHEHGLEGRVLPEMYCCYGSPTRKEQTEEGEPDFSEFDEVE